MRKDQGFAASKAQTFISAKTVGPIPDAGGLVHDALIQSSLDPEVLQIGFLRPPQPPAAGLEEHGVVVLDRRDGRCYLDVVPARPVRSIRAYDDFEAAMAAHGLRALTLAGADIMREPRFGSSRAVWRYRGFRTGLEMRVRILRALADETSLELDELCAIVSGPQDPILSVFSMACANLVEIDLGTHAIGPHTRVRRRD